MPRTNLQNTTYSDMSNTVDDYSVDSMTIDESQTKEFKYNNPDWNEYLGYYKQIPELKKSVDALAMWTAGKGWVANARDSAVLNRLRGWGEDTFDSIMQNMIIVKKINGDAYAEIIRSEDNALLNLKPLNPSRVRIVCNEKGIIIRYEEYDPVTRKALRNFKPNQIFHICNDRVANEIHGVSVIEACKWIIDARNEAMVDWRRILHRSSIRVLEVDADDSTTLSTLKSQYAEAINNGELLILPKQEAGGFQDLQTPPLQPFIDWIRYLEDNFYKAVGVPKIILGGAQDYVEASSKVGYLTFEQCYMSEQRLLEQDITAQLGLRVLFNRPTSLKDNVQSSEAANTGQVGIQPKEGGINLERE